MPIINKYSLSKPERAAAIIVAIGKERAAQILESFRSEELKAVMAAAQNLRSVEQHQLEELAREFQRDFQSGAGLLDSDKEFEYILSEFLGERDLNTGEVSKADTDTNADRKTLWEMLEEYDSVALGEFVGKQTVQLAATVMSKLSAKKVALVLDRIDAKKAKQIIVRMSESNAVSGAVLARVEAFIHDELRLGDRELYAHIDKRIAEILNSVDKNQSEIFIEALREEVTDNRVKNIERSIFRFEDIAMLESTDRTIVLDSIPSEILAMALVGASEELREAILTATSPRTRRLIEAEIAGMRNVNPERVASSRASVCSVVLKSIAEGLISLPRR